MNPLNRFAKILIPLFFLSGAVASAELSSFSVIGRVSVTSDERNPKCALCVGCGKLSGGIRRDFPCAAEQYFDSMKVEVIVRPKKVANVCQIEIVKRVRVLSPADFMPEYPDQEDLQKKFKCL